MDSRFLEMDKEFSNVGSKNNINVSFDIKRPTLNDLEPLDYSSELEDSAELADSDEEFILTIKLIYDDNDEHMKIINTMYSTNTTAGILSPWSMSEKFGCNKNMTKLWDINLSQLNEQYILEVSYDLTSGCSDTLLRIFSILSDAIKILTLNHINTNFTLFDVIKKIDEEYKNNKLVDCECAKVITQLITILNTNSNVTPDDAISLLYCFNALKSFDCSKLLKPINLMQLNNEILSTINELFLPKFNELADDSLAAKENQNKINKQQKNDINEFIKRINLWQRIKLFSPCLGKPAVDGGVYQWMYTEWYVLREIKFLLNTTANVYFDLTQKKTSGSVYQNIYAKDTDNHTIFEKELLALAPHINLSFPEKVNWHEKITFKPECSDYLFKMKLHFDIDTVKTLLKAKNNHRFFEQACGTGDFADLKTGLVREIIKEIFTLALGPVVSLDELNTPLNQSNTLRF